MAKNKNDRISNNIVENKLDAEETNIEETEEPKVEGTDVEETEEPEVEGTDVEETEESEAEGTDVEETEEPKVEGTDVEETEESEAEKYAVIHTFRDLEDKTEKYPNGYIYLANKDRYPRAGLNVNDDRLNQLLSTNNKIGKILIKADK